MGKKYLPKIKNSQDGGIGILKEVGVSSEFAKSMIEKYGDKAEKLGISRGHIDSVVESLEGSKEQGVKMNRTERRAAGRLSRKYPSL
ncbi:MAG: hypothetical protein FWG90_05090 [Oscillospiraceae bacterium]|nr:hypothetical protein [Oscillospiraceae bacterium]